MKPTLLFYCLSLLLVISSCQEEETLIDESQTEQAKFYTNFTLGDSTYSVTNLTHEIGMADESLICASNHRNGETSEEKYFTGLRHLILYPTQIDHPISSLSFGISKKVYLDELNAEDSMSYIKNIIYSDDFGFPIIPTGFFTEYNLEENIFIADRDVKAEAYLQFRTKDDILYQSTSVIPNERHSDSYFEIDSIIESSEVKDIEHYYIIQGRFRVDMFVEHYSTDSEIVEGEFRWPVWHISDDETQGLCQ
ncbi:MAG: hypothetical protein ACFB15_02610 [Cyclobacteriaceae bacterium]